MTDEQFRELRQLLLDLAVRVEALELHLQRQDRLSAHRFDLVTEWCATEKWKTEIETVAIDIPADLRRFLPPDQN